MGRPARWREAVAVTALAAAVAALMTYPAILNLDEAGRVDSPDGRWAIWNLERERQFAVDGMAVGHERVICHRLPPSSSHQVSRCSTPVHVKST